MKNNYLFTSESVTEGHPDKVCDQISDAILDTLIAQDPDSRVALEALIKTGLVVLAGEITTRARVDYASVARKTISDIGYTSLETGFDANASTFVTAIERQSPDISQGVNVGGAGDQGLMFGFACDDTPELMPLPISIAHRLMQRLGVLRRRGELAFLRPDGKGQVTVRYAGGKPVEVTAVVVSVQHRPEVSQAKIYEAIVEQVIKPTVAPELRGRDTVYHVNPTGSFVVGGPQGDCGVTGRKIIVDTYGGYGRHGGGALSGKDPTKVDRSGCYMARYAAKNVVGAGLAKKCEIQLAYAIGVAEPVSVLVDTFDTGVLPEGELASALRELFDFTPTGMIKTLELKRPIYQATAAYGHFGRPPENGLFPWERLDMVGPLARALGSDGRP